MFCLRQKVGSDKLGIGGIVGYHAYLRRACGHVDTHIVDADLLLGSHHILVAWAEYLVDLGDALCAIGHRADSLNTAGLEDLAHTGYPRCHQDGGIHLAFATRGRAKHNLLTTGYLGGCGQHQDSREEWGSATWDIESHLFDRYALLPAGHTGSCLHLLGVETLRLVEGLDIVVGQLDGFLQILAHQFPGLVDLVLCDFERWQVHMVELQLIAFHSLVASLTDVCQYGGYGLIQL